VFTPILQHHRKRFFRHENGKNDPLQIQSQADVYKSHAVEGSVITVTFAHTGSGLMSGAKTLLEPARLTEEPLRFFEIAGADGKWKKAEAKIVAPDAVSVFHPDIEDPKHVRYAWASYHEGANLYNREGYPASLFSISVKNE
jgi:sialate O-acetylesterase